MFMGIKKIKFSRDDKFIILSNDKFDGEKMEIINIKKILK